MSIIDIGSQDSISMDDPFLLVNNDPELKSSNEYQNLIQEVLQDTEEHFTIPANSIDINAENATKKSGCFLLRNIYYMGSNVLQKLDDVLEVNQCITDFSKQKNLKCMVSVSVPFVNNDCVRMYEENTDNLLAEFSISRIGFCTNGYKTLFAEYFAFSYLHVENSVKDYTTAESRDNLNVIECHIFKMKSPYYTNRILECFGKAFQGRSNNLISQPTTVRSYAKTINVQFKLTLDIKEDDGKGNFGSIPKEDNQIFKLRSNVRKKIIIKLEQINGPLCIERCMGLFIGAGRYLSDVDMTLLEMDSLGEITNKSDGFTISGEWNPCEKGFELLNCTRDKEQQVYLTIGISFCVQEIETPICLKLACKAKIYNEFQRFWPTLKKSTVIQLMLSIEETSNCELNQVLIGKYITKSVKYTWPDNILTVSCTPNNGDTNVTESQDSDNEEPMKSGSGIVKEDVTDELLIARLNSLLNNFEIDSQTRSKELNDLVKVGIPDTHRGKLWRLMASSTNRENELQEVYKILSTKETKFESVIKRDMPRIFTAHPLFIEKDGLGQESLFRVCKAYTLYDEELGYCQSSAFLAAALITHMPEEQAFTLLVCIMNDYRVRDLYKNNFEGLHICLYQLDNLMAEILNDLYMHFSELQLESHMYANQWFLTLFTTKFHLCAVFHILDLFLSEGIVIIFKVSLALLKLSKKDLLTMDIEGALNYFRITLPKLYRNEETSRELINTAINIRISNSKLLRLEKEWRIIQEVRSKTENPLEIMQIELKKIREEYNRLDQENDSLAKDLVLSKISLQKIIDKLDESLEVVNNELFSTRKNLVDSIEEKEHLLAELTMVKEKFREEIEVREEKLKQQESVICDFKKLATQLSERAEKAESRALADTDEKMVEHLKTIIEKCDLCRSCDLESNVREYNDNNIDKGNELVCMTKTQYWQQKDQIQETEMLLANTKLSLVESHCTQQNLYHEVAALRTIVAEQKETLEASKVSIVKKFWNLRDKSSEHKSTELTKSTYDSRHSVCQSDLDDRMNESFL